MIDNDAVVIACRQPLSEVSGLDLDSQVAWENVAFTPPAEPTLYVEERWITADELPVASNVDRVVGTYRLLVFCPRGRGTKDGRKLATDIKNRYPAGYSIAHAATTVTVLSSRVESGVEWDDTRYAFPVSIFVRSEATRN